MVRYYVLYLLYGFRLRCVILFWVQDYYIDAPVSAGDGFSFSGGDWVLFLSYCAILSSSNIDGVYLFTREIF